MASRRRSIAAGPQPAFVLHQYDWSESSLIVELFTRGQGRLVTVAKGAKKPTSNFRALLMPFQRLTVQLGTASGDEGAEVHNLRSAEWAGGVPTAGGAALFAAFYLNELLLKFLPRQDPHEAVFDAYADTLPALRAADDAANQSALRAFELALLRLLGWLPDLHCVTATQQPLQADARYAFHAESGMVAAPHGVPGERWREIDRALLALDLPALRLSVHDWRSPLRVMLREGLHYHLGASPLRTRRVRDGVLRLLQAPPEQARP